jgi:hypothetical protein
MRMRKTLLSIVSVAAVAGIAFAQVEAISTVYVLDVDPARYSGPVGQRIAVRLDDAPRHITLSPQDEICVQLQRATADSEVISARVRVLRPEPHAVAEVRVVAPDISPGTFRSTPWGMLLRVVPPEKTSGPAKLLGTTDAPVCSL